MPELPSDVDETVRRALQEDVGTGDVTTRAVVPADATAEGRFVAKAGGVICGLDVASRAFSPSAGRGVGVVWRTNDGARVEVGESFGDVTGQARAILTCERVALNFLTHLSGIATLTREFVDACAGTESVILCTRKTLPGLRPLERYAVEVGGGMLHRAGLFDAVLIKDNHVAIAGGVAEAVRRARAHADLSIEVEVDSIDQLEEALAAGADRILLDNADMETVKRAVAIVRDRTPLEVSGGMTLETVREIAPLGRLLISVGRITHSAPALDISLDVTVT
ncbi:MAG: carboxylating nicotinate-nucleotide diphosphorylase [Actinomycetota bacterium]